MLVLALDLVSGCEGEDDVSGTGEDTFARGGELEKVRAGVVKVDAVSGGVGSILRTQGVRGNGGVALSDA